MTSAQNQDLSQVRLFEPGVNRRVSLIVHEGDREHLVPGTNISMDDFHRYQLVGRQLQAQAMAAAFASLFRTIGATVKKVATAIGRANRQAAASRELAAMDDHLLADIGIRRQDIPAAVAGLLSRRTGTPSTSAEPVAPLAPKSTPACNQPHGKAAA